MELKDTPLRQAHERLGAKMTAFAGYTMPLLYSTVREEHLAVRNRCGLFDVSHMGEFIIKGEGARDLVQYVISNDVNKLEIGDAQYAYLPNEDGGIVDDLLVYRLDEDQCNPGEQAYMLVVNAANIEKDLAWITKHNKWATRIIDISTQTGLLALQGPQALEILSQHTDLPLSEIKYYTFMKGSVAEEENILVSATGYTGSGGFEIYAENDKILKIWTALMKGDKLPAPVGLGARDTLRLEKGYCLYGNDIDDKTSPWEAGLGWITKLKKGDFVGKLKLQKQKESGLVNKLVGFVVNDRRVPRHDYQILTAENEVIGKVTSGSFSPSLEIPIGMGYVRKEYSKPGTEIFVQAGKKKLNAKVIKMPFL